MEKSALAPLGCGLGTFFVGFILLVAGACSQAPVVAGGSAGGNTEPATVQTTPGAGQGAGAGGSTGSSTGANLPEPTVEDLIRAYETLGREASALFVALGQAASPVGGAQADPDRNARLSVLLDQAVALKEKLVGRATELSAEQAQRMATVAVDLLALLDPPDAISPDASPSPSGGESAEPGTTTN